MPALLWGRGGRGDAVPGADCGRACAGVCYKEAGTSLLHFSPPAPPTGSPQIAGRRLSHSQAAGSSQRGFYPPLRSQIVPLSL